MTEKGGIWDSIIYVGSFKAFVLGGFWEFKGVFMCNTERSSKVKVYVGCFG
jgi:hypothetical protein